MPTSVNCHWPGPCMVGQEMACVARRCDVAAFDWPGRACDGEDPEAAPHERTEGPGLRRGGGGGGAMWCSTWESDRGGYQKFGEERLGDREQQQEGSDDGGKADKDLVRRWAQSRVSISGAEESDCSVAKQTSSHGRKPGPQVW